MAKDTLVGVAKLLFTRDLRQEKQERLHAQVCDMLNGARGEYQLKRIAELFVWLNNFLAGHLTQEFKDVQDAYIDRVVASLIERSGYDAFYRAIWITMYDTAGWNERELAALRRFVIALYRVVGVDAERSMAFALSMLERFSRSKVNYLGMACLDPNNHTKNPEEQEAGAVVTVLTDSALAPIGRATPSKEWMLRLLEQVNSDRAVADVWESIIELMTVASSSSQRDQFGVFNLDHDVAATAAHREMYLSGELTVRTVLMGQNFFALPSTHHREFLRWGRTKRQKNDAMRERCESVEAWVRQHIDLLEKRQEDLMRDIVERPRRGLRPLGFDHVDINVSILRSAGVRGVIFRPEEFALPDTGLEILVRKVTPHLYAYKGSLLAFSDFPAPMIEMGFCQDYPLVRKLLQFVIIDVLHRITVAERPLREKSGTKGDSGTGEANGIRHPVPPHPRRLPEGWKASDEARQAWTETFGTTLREGYTFVRAHWSKGRMSYDLPTTAFATYGDEDLFSIGGET